MKKLIFLSTCCAAIVLLTQCTNPTKKKLEGIWRLQIMKVDSTVLSGPALGDWKWEFNEADGYLTDIAGAREKGFYSVKGDQLTLKSITNKERPEQTLVINHIDSLQLDLTTSDKKSIMHFLKLKEKDLEEKD